VTGKQYIGSTTQQLCQRMSKHKADLNTKNCMSRYVLENNNYIIELLELYPCNNVDELTKREQYYIDSVDCINKNKAWLTEEQKQNYGKYYYNENREQMLQKKAKKCQCCCGLEYTYAHKSRHLNSIKHSVFLSHNNIDAFEKD